MQIEALAGEDVVVDRLLAERMPEGDQLAVAFAAEDALVERLPERRGEGGGGELADLGEQLVVCGPADDRERADGLIGIVGEPTRPPEDDVADGKGSVAAGRPMAGGQQLLGEEWVAGGATDDVVGPLCGDGGCGDGLEDG